MSGKISQRTQAEVSMLIVAFIWGSTFVMTKNALQDIGPFLFLGIRFMLAFFVLALFSFNSLKTITQATFRDGSLIGFFLFLGYTCQTVGLIYTSSSNAGFITGLSVVLVPIIYTIINKRTPGFSTIVTVLLAVFGLYFMSTQPGTLHLNRGDTLVLVGALGFALHIIAVDRYSHRHNPIAITAVQVLFVGLFCLVIGLLTEPLPITITSNVVNAILITSIFATVLAFLLQNSMQKFSTPTRFAVILSMEPVFAGFIGYIWGGDLLNLRIISGMVLILVAMLLAILRKTENKEVQLPDVRNLESRY